MSNAVRWVEREAREMLPAFLFFLVAFNLIVITDALTTEEYGVRPFSVLSATIGALVAAKVVLLTNLLPFWNAFRRRPLVYNVVWKASLLVLAALLVRYVEHLIRFTARYGGLAAGNRRLIDEVVWSRFWAIQIWLAVLFLVFVAFQELSRALGDGRLRQLFLSPPHPD